MAASVWETEGPGTTLAFAAGLPRLKPGEVRRVRIIIEEP